MVWSFFLSFFFFFIESQTHWLTLIIIFPFYCARSSDTIFFCDIVFFCLFVVVDIFRILYKIYFTYIYRLVFTNCPYGKCHCVNIYGAILFIYQFWCGFFSSFSSRSFANLLSLTRVSFSFFFFSGQKCWLYSILLAVNCVCNTWTVQPYKKKYRSVYGYFIDFHCVILIWLANSWLPIQK